MAEGGSGHPQFITGAERLQPKVMQSLQFALQPVVEDISVKWNIPADISITPLSPLPNVLFQNQRAILYFQLTGQSSANISGSVSLHYTLDKKAVENTLTLNMKPKEDSSMLIHRLGARKAILALEGERGETGDKTGKERAVKMSVQSGVSSSYTAFIAVNTENKQPIKGPLLRRNIRSRPVRVRGGGGLRMVQLCNGAAWPPPAMGAAPMALASCHFITRRKRKAAMPPPMDAPETKDPLLELISLQKVDGSWDLQPSLASIFGKKEEEVATALPGKPEFVSVWATVLAVLWLHGHKMDFKDEWQFVAAKAVAWIRAQSGADLTGFVAAGNSFLGLQVELQKFGLQE
nr:von Willebrand factor A domain-containing protein 5A-like [Paramormyrops kingsleyae]